MPERDGEISPDEPVDVVNGVGESRRETLESEGYESVADLQSADVAELSAFVRTDVARKIKDQVGDRITNAPDVSTAKERARQIPGAKAKVVSDGNGHKQAKVLEKVAEEHVGGATLEIHKG